MTNEKLIVGYAGEHITVRSTADKSVLFTGIIKDLTFIFNFSADNVKENNTVECNIPGLAECKFYPFHILEASKKECKGQYDRVYEDKAIETSQDNFSQHTFSFEKLNGEVLFTAKLLKNAPKDWFETSGRGKRQRPPYNLLNSEKTQGIGYAENIYLHPIKQLIATSMKNISDMNLTCNLGDWYYALEEYIVSGKLVYLDGRAVVIEKNSDDSLWRGRKLFRPGTVVRDYVELGGEKVWYVATYSTSSNDNKTDATIVFQSDYAENAMLKFEGSFIRQSVPRSDKTPKRSRGYIAYYQIQGTISTIGKNGGEVSEHINLYSDETTIENLATSLSKPEVLKLLSGIHSYSYNQRIPVPTKTVGLDDLVGMDKVKQTFEEFRKFGEYRHMISLNSDKKGEDGDNLLALYNKKNHSGIVGETDDDTVSLHMAFLGSPGTGKTTVAERIASMLKEFGLVVTNEVPLVVVRSDLVGKYIGHTEEIVREKIAEAMGGILFVDEAYTLFESDSGNDFGKIALNEIMYAMEQHRNKLVVVLAGYTDEMLHMLKNANPGLTSRIPWHFYFDDYTAEQMWEILRQRVEKNDYSFDTDNYEAIKTRTLDYLSVLKKELDGIKEEGKVKHLFGNGRGVRTFFQYMQIGLAVRLASEQGKNDDLHTFTLAEVDYAFNTFKKGSEKLTEDTSKPKIGFCSS